MIRNQARASQTAQSQCNLQERN